MQVWALCCAVLCPMDSRIAMLRADLKADLMCFVDMTRHHRTVADHLVFNGWRDTRQ